MRLGLLVSAKGLEAAGITQMMQFRAVESMLTGWPEEREIALTLDWTEGRLLVDFFHYVDSRRVLDGSLSRALTSAKNWDSVLYEELTSWLGSPKPEPPPWEGEGLSEVEAERWLTRSQGRL